MFNFQRSSSFVFEDTTRVHFSLSSESCKALVHAVMMKCRDDTFLEMRAAVKSKTKQCMKALLQDQHVVEGGRERMSVRSSTTVPRLHRITAVALVWTRWTGMSCSPAFAAMGSAVKNSVLGGRSSHFLESPAASRKKSASAWLATPKGFFG